MVWTTKKDFSTLIYNEFNLDEKSKVRNKALYKKIIILIIVKAQKYRLNNL
ncbi:hypothetical protein CAPN005_21600 [Capnocytophaga cynodegmi]|nr:hypothetical protein CAPN005_21600 [Capnocytophaga cynodegmi]